MYQWFMNGAPYPGGTSTNLSLPLLTSAFNGYQFFLVASNVNGLSITSAPVTLTVQQAVYEPGFAKVERWDNNTTRQQVEAGTAGVPGYVLANPAFEASVDNPNTQANFARRLTTFFTPPTTGNYTFLVSGDDDTDLFVSTDATAANKRLVCQETGWSNPWTWNGVGNGTATQKHSDTWTPDGGATHPWENGIPLTAGQKYYVEMVFHQGGGGANVEATYKMVGEPDPANGTDTKLLGARIGMNAIPCTNITFTQQPVSITTNVFSYARFSVAGTTDSKIAVGNIRGNENTLTNNFLIYQWYKNGQPITNATASSVTI